MIDNVREELTKIMNETGRMESAMRVKATLDGMPAHVERMRKERGDKMSLYKKLLEQVEKADLKAKQEQEVSGKRLQELLKAFNDEFEGKPFRGSEAKAEIKFDQLWKVDALEISWNDRKVVLFPDYFGNGFHLSPKIDVNKMTTHPGYEARHAGQINEALMKGMQMVLSLHGE